MRDKSDRFWFASAGRDDVGHDVVFPGEGLAAGCRGGAFRGASRNVNTFDVGPETTEGQCRAIMEAIRPGDNLTVAPGPYPPDHPVLRTFLGGLADPDPEPCAVVGP